MYQHEVTRKKKEKKADAVYPPFGLQPPTPQSPVNGMPLKLYNPEVGIDLLLKTLHTLRIQHCIASFCHGPLLKTTWYCAISSCVNPKRQIK
ncbi:hypothetical protein CI102_7391 [Trichoderma harzianum]|nr:hypothetical protein CI102_7391 [Trichoderma harzianum]